MKWMASGISFAGIPAKKALLTYKFNNIPQSGTSLLVLTRASGEQTGMRGAIVVEPKGRERYPTAEDHVILLRIGRIVIRITYSNYWGSSVEF
jgi:FtsP/CotA-like multicopper oxidase with cupredoxin domain